MNGWQSVLLAVATVVGAIFAARITGRATQKAAKTSADEQAFVRAKSIYESALKEQDGRLDAIVADLELVKEELKATKAMLEKTGDQLESTRTELSETRSELRSSREEVSILRRSVSQYEGRVIQLTEVLRLHDIDVPPWTLNPSDYGILPGSVPDV